MMVRLQVMYLGGILIDASATTRVPSFFLCGPHIVMIGINRIACLLACFLRLEGTGCCHHLGNTYFFFGEELSYINQYHTTKIIPHAKTLQKLPHAVCEMIGNVNQEAWQKLVSGL